MTAAFGGWVLDHYAVAAWARGHPYAQALVWSAMEIGMAIVVPAAVLPFAYADTSEQDHGVLRELLELPVTLFEPLSAAECPELGRVLADAATPAVLAFDALAFAHVIRAAHRRGWAVLTGNAAGLRALDPHLSLDELPSSDEGTPDAETPTCRSDQGGGDRQAGVGGDVER